MPQKLRKPDGDANRFGAARNPGDAGFTLTLPVGVAAGAGGDSPAVVTGRRFRFNAYNGGRMRPMWWSQDLVVDLAGVSLGSQQLPALIDHAADFDCVLGQTTSVTVGARGIDAEGDVIAVSDEAREVVKLIDAGFKPQASIGGSIQSREYVESGVQVTVNGQQFTGPLVIARQTVLREISAVVLGADGSTSFNVVDPDTSEEPEVNPTADATAGTTTLTASVSGSATQTNPATVPPVMQAGQQATADPVARERERVASDIERIGRVQAAAGRHADIAATAVREGWTAERTELEVLRKERVSASQVSGLGGGVVAKGNPAANPRAVEAAMCLRLGVSEAVLAKDYPADVLNAATERPTRQAASLSGLLRMTIAATGRNPGYGSVDNELIRSAFEADRELRASGAGTTYSLTGILSNVANKRLLASFLAVNQSVLQLASVSDANDFKQLSRYRITADGSWEKVGGDGEIKSGTLAEESYTNQVDTYGKLYSITRKDWINDDLGAFSQVNAMLGRGAALTLVKAVASEVRSPTTSNFFHANNANLLTGGGSALSVSAIAAAVKAFREFEDAQGEAVMVEPRFIVVPPALEGTANDIFKFSQLVGGGSTVVNGNRYAGTFPVVVVPHLGSALGGGSDTAWYLFADPADVPAFDVAYLRGQRSPVIESSEADFDTLGMKQRGYFDFGVRSQDARGAVKNAGA